MSKQESRLDQLFMSLVKTGELEVRERPVKEYRLKGTEHWFDSEKVSKQVLEYILSQIEKEGAPF